jgi:hypothetical protein
MPTRKKPLTLTPPQKPFEPILTPSEINLIQKENFNMLRHIIKSERLKFLTRFYEKMHIDHDLKWKLEFDENITDSLNEEPIVVGFSKSEKRDNPNGLACVINYSVTICKYLVNWIKFEKDSKDGVFNKNLSFQSQNFIDVINNIEKHLNPSHDPDIEYDKETNWGI